MLQKSMRAKKRVVALYLLVPLIVYVFSVFVPLITAFVDSFFEWKGGPQKTFNGIQNYITLFQDTTFWQSFWHNIYLVAICIVGQIGIATGKIKRNASYLRILPEYDIRCMCRIYLENDL